MNRIRGNRFSDYLFLLNLNLHQLLDFVAIWRGNSEQSLLLSVNANLNSTTNRTDGNFLVSRMSGRILADRRSESLRATRLKSNKQRAVYGSAGDIPELYKGGRSSLELGGSRPSCPHVSNLSAFQLWAHVPSSSRSLPQLFAVVV